MFRHGQRNEVLLRRRNMGAYDFFARANQVLDDGQPPADSGQYWHRPSGIGGTSCSIAGNKAVVTAGGQNAASFFPTTVVDGWVSASIVTAASGGIDVGFFFRSDGQLQKRAWFVQLYNGAVPGLRLLDGSQNANPYGAGGGVIGYYNFTPVNGKVYILTVQCTGQRIQVYLDGILRIDYDRGSFGPEYSLYAWIGPRFTGGDNGSAILDMVAAPDMILNTFGDDFNRADGPIGNGWGTSNYPGNSAPTISAQTVVITGGGGGLRAAAYFRQMLATPNYVQIQCAALPSNINSAIEIHSGSVMGANPDGTYHRNGISFYTDLNGHYTIFEIDNDNAIAQAQVPGTFTSGDWLMLRQVGKDYAGYKNGAEVVRWANGAQLTKAPMGPFVGIQPSGGGVTPPTTDNFLAHGTILGLPL